MSFLSKAPECYATEKIYHSFFSEAHSSQNFLITFPQGWPSITCKTLTLVKSIPIIHE